MVFLHRQLRGCLKGPGAAPSSPSRSWGKDVWGRDRAEPPRQACGPMSASANPLPSGRSPEAYNIKD